MALFTVALRHMNTITVSLATDEQRWGSMAVWSGDNAGTASTLECWFDAYVVDCYEAVDM